MPTINANSLISGLGDNSKIEKAISDIDETRAKLLKLKCRKHKRRKAVALAKEGPLCKECTNGKEASDIRRLGGIAGIADTKNLGARLAQRGGAGQGPGPSADVSSIVAGIVGRWVQPGKVER